MAPDVVRMQPAVRLHQWSSYPACNPLAPVQGSAIMCGRSFKTYESVSSLCIRKIMGSGPEAFLIRIGLWIIWIWIR